MLDSFRKFADRGKLSSRRLGASPPTLISFAVWCLVTVNWWNTSKHVLTQDTFDWAQIQSSETLDWTPCNTDFECARLKTPLDYANPNASSTSIALVRLAATVPRNSSDYRGPILFNPGGPGGSGVDTILELGSLFRTILGPSFDLVGFDPRGIARSLPRASFFTTQAERAQFPPQISLNASQDAFGRTMANSMLEATLAGARDDHGSLRFINTEATARDMMKIVEAYGEEKLQYWGFSYGTVLGATFAAMFPDKIGRMAIDGVLDADDYYSAEYRTPFLDIDKTWKTFLDGCVAAGPDACALYEQNTTAIQAKILALERQLLTRPVPAIVDVDASSPTPAYHAVDYSLLRLTMFDALYKPYKLFQPLASALHDLISSGNASALYEMSVGGSGSPPLYACPANSSAEDRFASVIDAGIAVICNDGKSISADYEDVKKNYEALCATSSWCDVFSMRMPCLGWPEYLKNDFTISFKTNTSFPLLVISNTADPVTPRPDGVKMSSGFAGSVLLTQDSPGHASLSAPSSCTMSHVAAYFVNGTLPAKDTVCSVDATAELFPSANSTESIAARGVRRSREEELSEALRKLAQSGPKMFKGHGRF
ncbi:Abhydrolase-4 domain-containing protein [Favolaschia claudopus]|uniref:Abhydrolase-4 domain-containing protein n=1 Tax=Favolaschia claudopus TaxID=2862362 RepID=A0AAW0CBN1_9AGAR